MNTYLYDKCSTRNQKKNVTGVQVTDAKQYLNATTGQTLDLQQSQLIVNEVEPLIRRKFLIESKLNSGGVTTLNRGNCRAAGKGSFSPPRNRGAAVKGDRKPLAAGPPPHRPLCQTVH